MLKTLDWRDTFKVESIIKKPTLDDLFDFDPLMLTGIIVVGGVGALAIGLAWLERRLAKKDDERAMIIQIIGTVLLICGFIYGFFNYIIIHNPLWKFF
jgi:preprotein translocase subunit Sss1